MRHHNRILLKTLSWQILGFAMMVLLAYIYTGSLRQSGGLAASSMALGAICYACHEYLWSKIS